ncbi:helix-turn-helix transcriptional regulator [Aquimarina sp. U1-2]|uniref:helix-turn-helix domain-containing protein n=1 Tax=Aquimarina sp. U1-2 TaxID=2823141 RepID=UPI001AECF35F|nr:helix-turn-helix transcriptional regulator [Aquimarina sp. U1-2]MBP2831814.1 helix-turn-helix transcriptional regulator [Aquimarina sp. U1-2]
MFGTTIHWTTFFYLLIDVFIVLFAILKGSQLKQGSIRRYINLGGLFIAYNLSGGFLPITNFPGPLILQYIINYGIAIWLCVYMAYYLYMEFDIVMTTAYLSIKKIILLMAGSFVFLYLLPFYITNSITIARACFTIPVAGMAFYFLWAFREHVKRIPKTNSFMVRRYQLSMLCAVSIVLLPVLTLFGDYQWLTFTVMNSAFYAITAIEIDRYLYFLENRNKLYGVFSLQKGNTGKSYGTKLVYENLTRREIEIAISILSRRSYKEIGENFYIAERTVSKHASNIFKKTGVKNRTEFLKKFHPKRK